MCLVENKILDAPMLKISWSRLLPDYDNKNMYKMHSICISKVH